MSGFSPEWLTLREPADHRARDPMLALKVADRLQKLPRITVTDLGCGTGSNIRAWRRTGATRKQPRPTPRR